MWNSLIDVATFLSFLLFLLTTDYLTIPLFLAILVTIFTERTFINVTFGLGVLAYLISLIPGKGKAQIVFKMSYIILSILSIGAIFVARPSMFIELPTLISAIAFIIFTGLLIRKWSGRILSFFGNSIT